MNENLNPLEFNDLINNYNIEDFIANFTPKFDNEYEIKIEDTLSLCKFNSSIISSFESYEYYENNEAENELNFKEISTSESENYGKVLTKKIDKKNQTKKRTFDKSEERQFILFFNTFLKLKIKNEKIFNLFEFPNYYKFNNKFKNQKNRTELLKQSFYTIILDDSYYLNKETTKRNKIVLDKLVCNSNLISYLKLTSVGSFITSDTIEEVFNSKEFNKKINKIVEKNPDCPFTEIKNKILKYLYEI